MAGSLDCFDCYLNRKMVLDICYRSTRIITAAFGILGDIGVD